MPRTAKAPTWRFATLLKTEKGKFTTWKAGTVVKVRLCGKFGYFIERVKWRAPKLPLMNQCFGIAKSSLDLHGIAPAPTHDFK
jgi:hypothetical protein